MALNQSRSGSLLDAKNSSGLHRGLLAAGVALEELARAALDHAMAVAATVGTFEAMRPAQPRQFRVTPFLGPI